MNELEAYLQAIEMGEKSPHTIIKYRGDLKKLYDFFKIESLGQLKSLTVSDFHSFYLKQQETLRTPQSFNGLVRSLSAFFNYLKETKKIETHEFFQVRFGKGKFKKVNKEKKIVLSKDEEVSIIESASNLQDKFMIAMMLKTALRRSEIVGIKISDIKDCEILITGKGGDEAYTYLNDNLCALLNEYLSKERDTDSEFLFYSSRGESSPNGQLTPQSVNNRIKSAARKAGISEERVSLITAHTLRRTAITRMAFGRGKYAAQMLARHKSDSTTDLYIAKDNDFVKELLMEE
jgi:integrase